MKILVVEDEQHSREHLAALLCENHEIFEADNAPLAMEIFEREKPALVLTDICMPQKSGVELTAYIAEKEPQTIIVMITGFSDFQYTKAAIEYGVFDYLLKPVSREKLFDVIGRAAKKIAEENRKRELQHIFQRYYSENRTHIRRQHFENLLFRRLDSGHVKGEGMLDFGVGPFRLVAIRSVGLHETLSLEGEYYVTTYLQKYILRKLPDTVASTFGNIMYWLWIAPPAASAKTGERLDSFLSELQKDIQKRFFCSLSIGVSEPSEKQQDMYLLRKQALKAISEEERDGIFFYEDLDSGNEVAEQVRHDLNELIALIKKGNKEKVLDVFHGILESGQTASIPMKKMAELMIGTITFYLCSTKLYSEEIGASSEEMMGRAVKGNPLGKEELESWICAVCDAIHMLQTGKSDCLIDTVLQYINDSYHHPIGLEEASRLVKRNPSYISRLIKEKTDKSFTVLLTERRMEAAKHLLKHSTKKIHVIAGEVGYPNPNYFDRVFKQAVGMNPNEYRLIAAAFKVN